MANTKDCPGTYNLHDNVRVLGRDHKKHDENLDNVRRKFEEHGLAELGVHGRSAHGRGAADLQEESGSDC